MNIRVVGIVAAVGLALAACSSSSSSKVSSASGAAPTTAGGASTTAGSSGGYGGYSYGGGSSATTAAPSGGGVQIALSAGHLVGPGGKTVYMFDKDNGTTSACTDGCASVWPAVTSSGTPAAGSGVDASKLSTATGQAPDQVTYAGHLLYEFSGDSAPGQTNGTKIPGWHDVSAAGTAAS
jgi:predicted lipoprotein with Yx(FWY)xxD motif